MFTDQYFKALVYANNIAQTSNANKIDSYYFLAGILCAEQSEMAILFNSYGINSDWFYKIAPSHIQRYDVKKSYYDMLPFNRLMSQVVEGAEKLAKKNNSDVDLIHVIYSCFKPHVSFLNSLIRKKISYVELENFKNKLFQMISKQVVVNQVTIE